MRVIVKKWGNSASVRIPAAIMAAARLSLDETVDVREENQGLTPVALLLGLFLYGVSPAVIAAAPAWVKSSGSVNVAGALVGGQEGTTRTTTIGICRGEHKSAVYSGKLVGKTCYIGFVGVEVALSSYEILMADSASVSWVAGKSGTAPVDGVIGGKGGGKDVPVCRISYQSGTHPGRLVGTTCNIGWGGKEITSATYEVLTSKEPATTGIPPPPAPTVIGDTLASGKKMELNSSLQAPNGYTKLIFQTDGNLVLYNGNKAVWAANTGKTSSTQQDSKYVLMHTDGRLIVMREAYTTQPEGPKWSTATDTDPGAYAQVTDNGRLVVLSKKGAELWASSENKLGPWSDKLKTGESLHASQKLVSTDNQYELKLLQDGSLALYDVKGKSIWSGRTGEPDVAGWGVRLTMSLDGVLSLLNRGKEVWTANYNTANKFGDYSYLMVTKTGDAVVYSADGKEVKWSARGITAITKTSK